MIGHAVVRPTGVMVLPYSALTHIGPIFLLFYLLKNPREFRLGGLFDYRLLILSRPFLPEERFKRILFLNLYL